MLTQETAAEETQAFGHALGSRLALNLGQEESVLKETPLEDALLLQLLGHRCVKVVSLRSLFLGLVLFVFVLLFLASLCVAEHLIILGECLELGVSLTEVLEDADSVL